MIPHHDFQIAKKLSYFFFKISGLFGNSLAQSTESKNFAKIFWLSVFRWNFPGLRNFSHSESNNTSNKYLSPSNWFISLLNRLFIIFVFFSYLFLSNNYYNFEIYIFNKNTNKKCYIFFSPQYPQRGKSNNKKSLQKTRQKNRENVIVIFSIFFIYIEFFSYI